MAAQSEGMPIRATTAAPVRNPLETQVGHLDESPSREPADRLGQKIVDSLDKSKSIYIELCDGSHDSIVISD